VEELKHSVSFAPVLFSSAFSSARALFKSGFKQYLYKQHKKTADSAVFLTNGFLPPCQMGVLPSDY